MFVYLFSMNFLALWSVHNMNNILLYTTFIFVYHEYYSRYNTSHTICTFHKLKEIIGNK